MDNLPKPAIKKKPEEELVATSPLTREPLLALGISAINGPTEPKFEKVRPEQEEPKESGVTMDDLPELPFEKILGYLSLQERIKCRAVSRRWCKTIDSFRPKSLCLSKQPSGFIYEKSRWISGEFARNFVNSAKFDSFLRTFGQSILSNLKKLRLCDLELNEKEAAAFALTLNSFGRLEELDMIWFGFGDRNPNLEFKLNLPMLNSIQIKGVKGIVRPILDAPKLKQVVIRRGSPFLNLDIVRVESVEKLIIRNLNNTEVRNLKNLKYLYTIDDSYEIDSTFISGLEQLQEIHLLDSNMAWELFEQKERYGRVDLKIFLCGCLLSDPDDPVIDSLWDVFGKKTLAYLGEHPDRLTHQIPFWAYLNYSVIEAIPRGLEISILNRFTDLHRIIVSSSVQDIERFLDILKSLDHIADLQFECDQAQELFNRLPDHCAVQELTIEGEPDDFGFLCRLDHLIELNLRCEINAEFIREILEKLKFLSLFKFKYSKFNNGVIVKVKHHPKRFTVWLKNKRIEVSDLDSLIRFIVKSANE